MFTTKSLPYQGMAYKKFIRYFSRLILTTSPQSHLRKARRSSAYKKNSKLLNPHSPIKCTSSPNGNRAAANGGGLLAAGKTTVLMVIFVRFST